MIIEVDKDKTRIDNFLNERLDMSRSKIQRLIKSGNILVGSRKVNPNYLVKIGDKISVEEVEEFDYSNILPQDIKLDIVYEDDDLLVINKKSGMVVHPAPGHYKDTLVNALLYRFKLSNNNSIRPGIVHRLDKDTSGLMLVAKNDFTHELLSSMIKNKEVQRHYLALVEGVIMHSSGTIDAPIGRDVNNRQKMSVTQINSKNAVTRFKVLKRFENTTLVECILETGRTHQIRVHMKYINHPVVNDPLYNSKKSNDFGQMLHSKSIEFIHPRTKEKLFFEVESPEEFIKLLPQI